MDDVMTQVFRDIRPVTSRSNPQVRRLDDLLRRKKAREESRLLALEGRRLVLDAWAAGLAPQTLYLTPEAWQKAFAELEPLRRAAGEVVWLEASLAARIGDTQAPQGVFALCPQPPTLIDTLTIRADGRYLLLHQVRDPGNLGSILRTAAALGADGAFLCDCAEVFSPKVLRASMGGLWRLPIALVNSLDPILDRLQQAGVATFAAALREGAKGPGALASVGGRAVLIGNEGDGLPEHLINACSHVVMLPMKSGSDSLGASMAAGILLWEMLKER